ncbi:MAG: hypothetical protein HY954_04700 [Deltaproteobacteria bacterium]|nr:hypothetical protein [Deltaproteobacteria bacterium]
MLQLKGFFRNWRTLSISTALSWLMKSLMVALIPYEIYKGEYLFSVAAIMAVVISLVPSIVQRNYRITLPFELDFLITLSLFLHTFMGEGMDFYQRFEIWDQLLHLYGGGVVALLGFVIVYTLHYTRKVRLSIPLIGFFTIIFAMGVGGLWEIGEYSVDVIFKKRTQDGLDDTMMDMIDDLIGGLVVSVLGMLYVKYSSPDTRVRLAKPLGEIFGIGKKIDLLMKRIIKSENRFKKAKDDRQ